MHSSSHELGLLELQQFLIKEQRACGDSTRPYNIFDPSTQVQVGVVRPEPGSLARFLRWFLPWMLVGKLEVCETEDESLVFTVRCVVGLRGQRIEIYDADDHFMGCGENSAFSGSAFQLYDRNGLPFAKVGGEFRAGNFRFVSRDGRELGVVAREAAGLSGEAHEETDHCLVSVHEELAELPLAKMLLLGTALAIDMIYHGEGDRKRGLSLRG